MTIVDRSQFAAAWPRGRAAALAGVTIVDALLVGLWLQQRQTARDVPPVERVLQLVLLPLSRPEPAPALSAPARPAVAPRERRSIAPALEAITLPNPPAPLAPEPVAITAEPPRPAASAEGLNLRLPRSPA